MKKFTQLVLVVLTLSVISCSENTEIEDDQTNNEAIVIPNDKQIEIEILEKINNYRIGRGLTPFLKLNIIKSQTYPHTTHMLICNRLSHDNFPTRSAFLKSHLGAQKVGENVAVGQQYAEDVVNSWLNSEDHLHNIVGNYTHFDISAEQNDEGVWFYTNIFVKK